jgi:hypothetical protein
MVKFLIKITMLPFLVVMFAYAYLVFLLSPDSKTFHIKLEK